MEEPIKQKAVGFTSLNLPLFGSVVQWAAFPVVLVSGVLGLEVLNSTDPLLFIETVCDAEPWKIYQSTTV